MYCPSCGSEERQLSQKQLPGESYQLKYEAPAPANLTNELGPGAPSQLASITEHTTHHLKQRKS